ncbi:MAG TPA: complex I NDUFA9 subunit family protein [Halothiobacillaceae bacterium]|nr:complex I NDUFA9 subunit family protein [Halothiobacillaceae bacterium]
MSKPESEQAIGGMELGSNGRIVVFGGTGFVGRHLVRALSKANYQVIIPSRHVQRHRDMQLWPRVDLFDTNPPANSDIATQRNVIPQHELMLGAAAVINLVGILNEKKHNGEGFEKAHVTFTQTVLKNAHRAGVSRYLHMSALGASAEQGASFYQKTKGRAEDYAHQFGVEHDIAVTSFRPSVIFGPGDNFFNQFARLAAITPGVFPLACPQARMAPVYVGDVVNAFVHALKNPADTRGERLDLCGPEEFTLKELVQMAARSSGHPRWILGLPNSVSKLQARIFEWLPGKPFTRDNYYHCKRQMSAPMASKDNPPGLLMCSLTT